MAKRFAIWKLSLGITDHRSAAEFDNDCKSQASYDSSRLGRNLGEISVSDSVRGWNFKPSDHAMFNSEIEDNPRDFNILYKNHYRAAEIK